MLRGLVFADRYRLEKFIGQGGMSLVYRAVDNRTGHSVAIKILKSEFNSDKEFLERFQREAQAASLMSHHNIVNLLDVGVEGEYRYLVLEYVNGLTLKDIVRQRGKLDAETTTQIAIRILSALQHAHSKGIVHRDIKPQNVLVHADGHVKVSDFGIARMTNTVTISQDNTVLGSVHYSSPEQATGSVVNATSDLYSTGVVIYEMLTGHVPFVGDTPVAVALQQVNAAIPPIENSTPDVPAALVQVVMKALEKDPTRRFQSAREMAEALNQAKEGSYVAKPPTTPASQRVAPLRPSYAPKRHKSKPSKKNWLLGFSGIVSVLLTLVIGIMLVVTQVSNSVFAPDVTGLTSEEAQTMIARSDLNFEFSTINHAAIAKDVVISQVPLPNTQMARGDSLFVTISQGPAVIAMPDVMNQSYEEATDLLANRDVSVVVVKVVSTQLPGTVIAQKPLAGEALQANQTVELTISGGSVTVPSLMGMTYEEAVLASQHQRILLQPIADVVVVQDSQVTLTIGKGGEAYQADVMVVLPAGEDERTLLVTLIIGDEELEKYQSTIPGGTSGDMIVPVSSSIAGTYLCKVSVDDVVIHEELITFE